MAPRLFFAHSPPIIFPRCGVVLARLSPLHTRLRPFRCTHPIALLTLLAPPIRLLPISIGGRKSPSLQPTRTRLDPCLTSELRRSLDFNRMPPPGLRDLQHCPDSSQIITLGHDLRLGAPKR